MRDPAVSSPSLVARAGCALAAIGLLVGVGGCKPPRTQLLVVLDTDMPDCQLSDLRLRCANNWDPSTGDPPSPTCDYPLHRGLSAATIRLPGSFGVIASETHLTDPVTLVVDDSSGETIPALRRIVQVNFVPHETMQLVIRLVRACTVSAAASTTHPCPLGLTACTLSQSCEAQMQTCGNNGTCRPIEVMANELQVGGDGGLPDSSAEDARACD